ncbi:MAG: hypothetical protein J7J36_04025, partial [Thermoplasmata archaeon]|nr:hypothetical protein [Thermoplasmata archaeon]
KIKTEDVLYSSKETIEKYGKIEKILVDNDKRFAKEFEKWCKNRSIEVEHAPFYYPTNKRKD